MREAAGPAGMFQTEDADQGLDRHLSLVAFSRTAADLGCHRQHRTCDPGADCHARVCWNEATLVIFLSPHARIGSGGDIRPAMTVYQAGGEIVWERGQ